MTTKSQTAASDISASLRARTAFIWITTQEEARVERYLIEACSNAGYLPRFWDCAAGIREVDGSQRDVWGGQFDGAPPASADLSFTLNVISQEARQPVQRESANERGNRCAWILRDLHKWVEGPVGVQTLRQLRNLARFIPGTARARAQAIIVISPSGEIPPELQGHVTVFDWPSPDREEIAAILDRIAKAYSLDLNGNRDQAIDAAVGLSEDEAASCYAKSLVQTAGKRIDPVAITQEKKRVIAKSGVLEWFDPIKGGLDAVGGLENLKSWLVARKAAFSPQARAYGLPSPKGTLLVGIPGGGKSLTAKAIATAWACPLIRMDLGALKSKFVGESEANLRKALRTIEAIGRCVVWLDEVEKAMAGAIQGAADGGVSADALGTILSWMQDRAGEAFVVATANDVSALPPEFLRKGRFDEVWFVDLPTATERVAILAASLRAYGRGEEPRLGTLAAVADVTEGFTGAELASLVPEALHIGFADGERAITSNDLMAVAKQTTPLSKTAKEKIDRLRGWAVGRARSASAPEAVERDDIDTPLRVLDLP